MRKSGYSPIEPLFTPVPLSKRERLLSIIVPVYNREKTLADCITSLLQQETEYDYEIVCIDDGSTDESLKLLKGLQIKNEGKLTVYSQPNRGVSAARNKGIELAKGEYIGFVDSDDTVAPQFVERMMSAILDYSADMAQPSYRRVRSDGTVIYEDTASVVRIKNNDGSADYEAALYGFAGGGIYGRKLFAKMRYPEGYRYEDMITKFVLARESRRTVVLPECLYDYTLHESNASDQLAKDRSIKQLDGLYLPMKLFNYSSNVLHLPNDEALCCMTIHELCWQLPNRIDGLPLSLRKSAFVIIRQFMVDNGISTERKECNWDKLSKMVKKGDFYGWQFLAYHEKYKSKIQ